MRALVKELWRELRANLPDVQLVGPALDDERLCNTLTLLFPGIDGKVLVTALDLGGLEVSAGSACASGSIEPSHVLAAMGYDDDEARAGLRLSLGWNTTRDDCAHAVDTLRKSVAASRASRGTRGAL
jgi:cysteine desulfurase